MLSYLDFNRFAGRSAARVEGKGWRKGLKINKCGLYGQSGYALMFCNKIVLFSCLGK